MPRKATDGLCIILGCAYPENLCLLDGAQMSKEGTMDEDEYGWIYSESWDDPEEPSEMAGECRIYQEDEEP